MKKGLTKEIAFSLFNYNGYRVIEDFVILKFQKYRNELEDQVHIHELMKTMN